MSERTAVVRRFVEAFRTRDLDRIMLFFTDDCVYHNIPLDPVTGPAAIKAVLQGFVGMSTAIEFELLQIAARSTLSTAPCASFGVGSGRVS